MNLYILSAAALDVPKLVQHRMHDAHMWTFDKMTLFQLTISDNMGFQELRASNGTCAIIQRELLEPQFASLWLT